MNRWNNMRQGQRGVILIESLMAILIFALGILALVGVNSVATNTQSDARFRSDANRLASKIVNEMWVNVNRTNEVTVAASLAAFSHRADVADPCDRATAGTASADPLVTNWVAMAAGGGVDGLPGATDKMQQIVVNAAAGNQVTVTVCWQAPSDVWVRRHSVTTYIN